MRTTVRTADEGEAGTAMKELLIAHVRFEAGRQFSNFIDAHDILAGSR
jgi:hypothetical protein